MVAWSIAPKVLGVLVAVIALLAVGAVLFLGVSASTLPLRDASGNVIPGSAAVLERVELGGLEQWITIRGADVSKPLLLWLHGGPGSPQMPLAHHLDRRLEQEFVFVHWDQRGAGKSNHGGIDEATMRFGRFFNTNIGVSQVVDHDRATEIARDWLRSTIDPAKAPEDLRALEAIAIPARRHSEYRALAQLVTAYGGNFDVPITRLAGIAARAPEYVVGDYLRLLRGMNRGGGPMHEGGIMANPDIITTTASLDVPAYFFAGARDYNTTLVLVQAYAEVLEAPHVELVVFEQAAHLPFLAEPERFVDEVIRVASR